MQKVFGDYYSTMTANQLTLASKNKNEASPELADKKGKRVAMSTELEERQTLQMGAIKQWTGRDPIVARMLYGKPFTFTPQFTLHIQTNELPTIAKIDDSIRRRVRVIDYPSRFCSNPTLPNEKRVNPALKEQISSDPELWNAIAHDLLDVYRECCNMPEIAMPTECIKHTNMYLDENDSIKTWFDENLEKSEQGKVKADELYRNYVSFMHKDSKTLSNTAFGRIMSERFGIEKKRSKAGMQYLRICLLTDDYESINSDDDY
jgi:P4 family phage/plasmid primase-like protien